MKIGVLAGGGDCPGLNAVIRAVVRKSDAYDSRVIGIRNGWKGLVELAPMDLDIKMVSGILHIGGTIIGTSRTNPFKDPSGPDFTFGFDTAVSIATDAIDRIHTTAESHNRVMVVEVMGRNAGWIAT